MTYTWKRKWILPYESIWGSVEKFKYANAITNRNLSKIIEAKSKSSTIYIYPSMYACNNNIDLKTLTKILNKDVFKKTRDELEEFLGCIYNAPDLKKYMVSTWRYCPECIKNGYHSICNQLIFFDKCLFHNVHLQTKCPNCDRESYYVIDYSDYKHGLKCACEYNYILDKTPINIFRAWESQRINNKIIDSIRKSKFPSSKEGIIYFYPSFIWFLVHDLKSNLFNTSVKAFFEIVKSKELPTNAIKFKVSLKHSIIPKFSDSIYDGYSFIMMNEYIGIIKGIAKHIRRKYRIKKNSINLYKSLKLYFFFDYFKDKLSSEELYYKNIDAEVFAYIMWRRDIEGHEYYDHIHTRKTKRSSDDPLASIKVNITGTLFYKYISNEFRMYFNSYRKNEYITLDDYGVLVDSFERILSNLLIRHYNNWLTYAIKVKTSRPNEIIDFKSVISPPLVDYIVQYNKNGQEAHLISINIKNQNSHTNNQ